MSTNHTPEILANLAKPTDLDDTVMRELDAAQARGIPIKAVAADTGIALSRLYAIAEGRSHLYLSEAPRFMRTIASDGLLDALARSRGALVFFVRPTHERGFGDVYEAFAKAAAEMADVPRTLGSRLEDGNLSVDDARAVAEEIDQWVSAAAAMKELVLRKASAGAGVSQ
ncbi:MAG TPA: phage regulatory CII family protein [Gemmatimonadaceae bacterium]|nr:phage regulatory CII family protein [Gemmatimonadaceae bacterium]